MKHPDYQGSRDECVRMTIETRFERSIKLKKCCGKTPKVKFRAYNEFFVECEECGAKTELFKHAYEAKQVWNEGLR